MRRRVPQGLSRRQPREARQPAGAPWHFWLVVVMATVYLGWRVVQGVVWLIRWII